MPQPGFGRFGSLRFDILVVYLFYEPDCGDGIEREKDEELALLSTWSSVFVDKEERDES